MKNSTISRQLGILVAVFAIAMPTALAGLSYVLSSSASSVRRLSAEGNRRTGALFAVVAAIGKVQSSAQRLVREKDPDAIEKLLNERNSVAAEALVRIREADSASGGAASVFQELAAANEKSAGYVLRGDYALAQQVLLEDANPAYERLVGSIENLQQASSRAEEAASSNQAAGDGRAQTMIFVLTAAALAGWILLAVRLLRTVNGSLRRAVRELGGSCNSAASASEQVSSASHSVARGASEQAATLEETSASAESVTTISRRNAGQAKIAAQRMQQAMEQVAQANERLEQMRTSMNEINASGSKISRIIKTIDDIAFQTNILALNAAVEAARAGETGLGFAVVADEVRNLAQRSAQAARETAALIEESVTRSSDGVGRLRQVAEAVESITAGVTEVKALVDGISSESDEQARGMEHISQAIEQMQQVTQRTAAEAAQSSAATEELSAQAATLENIVVHLGRLVDGAAARR